MCQYKEVKKQDEKKVTCRHPGLSAVCRLRGHPNSLWSKEAEHAPLVIKVGHLNSASRSVRGKNTQSPAERSHDT